MPGVELVQNRKNCGRDWKSYQLVMRSGDGMAKVFIIILNWNGGKDTVECLRSVDKIDYPKFEIVVVDNGSTDGSVEAIRKRFPHVTLLENGQNLGYAAGNNVGIRHGLANGAGYILLLNNDTVVDPQLLSHLVQAADEHPEAGIYQPKICFFSDPRRIWFGAVRWVPSEGLLVVENQGEIDPGDEGPARPTAFACGCALFFRAAVAQDVGLFDPRFFLCWEEIDWCFRAQENGYQCLFVPSAKVYHKVSASIGTGSLMRRYFDFRNHLLWAQRNLPAPARHKVHQRSFRLLRKIPRRIVGGLVRGVVRWHYLAIVHASIDYLLGRFGDCPRWIRVHSTRTEVGRENGPIGKVA